jgi:hypothetical protein
MTPPLRDTRYAREIASAKLPSGPRGKSFVAIERIFVKKAKQEEIRFSLWEGSRMMPRPLDLPEQELLPLLQAAIGAGVFSEAFVDDLRAALNGVGNRSQPAALEDLTDLERVQAHFHELMRARAGDALRAHPGSLPSLAVGVGTEEEPGWFPIHGMNGGFKYWWDAATSGLRLMAESWSETVAGSGQLHEVTPAGARLLGEGFV